ncbi:HTTM domain-containing protein [Halorubrum sp. JWXQ-INN 858]|uniref:HTTM domain-containing protein n=1 Tax=Halorubrum sp. JWXQ-INN 858 TaxID=2690782 RepID=UPI001359B074|nr:HTTM domain-containing protein [Halorubrum sp. JWXQ-INN 858]MWV64201.1 HTTM domain-containing protein [Halorubrum sp. JWXQ-INN 858]
MTSPASARSTATRLSGAVRERVRIDARSLALFRIVAGVLIVADVLSRSRNLVFFYTDEGVVPTSLAVAAEPAAAYSVYTLAPTPAATAALFALTAVVGVALALGYYTRVVTVLAFVLVVSLDLRNPFVLSFADTLFATLLFYAMFLPLGERWSIDAVAADRPRRGSVAGVATALVLAQMVTMYLVNGYHKTVSELWWSGEATVLILGIDEITFLFGDALRAFPTLLQAGGLLWFGMLLGAWLLLVLRDRPRHLLVAAFASVHLSLALTVRIGAFSYVCLMGLTLFLQPSAWRDGRAAADRIAASRIARLASAGRATAAGLRTRAARLRERAIVAAERVPRPLVAAPLARLVVRRAESVFGRRFEPTRRTAGAVAVVAVAVAIGVLASLSAAGVVDDDTPRTEVEAGAAALVDFQADWSIFAPNPRTVDRYYVFPAVTTDGDLVDARNDRELTYDRPYDRLQRQHATYRERFYMASLPGTDDEPVADHLVDHLCATYEADDGATLTHVNVYRISESITRETIDDPAGRERTEIRLSRHACDDGEPRTISPPGDDRS